MSSLTLAETISDTVTEHHDSAITPGSTSTTGNTETALVHVDAHVQGQKSKRKWLEKFRILPTEIHINIMAQLELDPVTQISLGVTSRHFYDVYHALKDWFLYDGSRVYPIKSMPLDLRMQISECERYMYHGWYNSITYDWDDSVQWGKPLGKLLENESFWGSLKNCASCAKYKPEEAFAISQYEQRVEEKHADWKETVEHICGDSHSNICKRCRAKVILIHIEKRDEWKADQILEEERTSLGLRKLDWENLIVDGDPLRAKLTLQAFLEVVGGYETWDEVFENLGI